MSLKAAANAISRDGGYQAIGKKPFIERTTKTHMGWSVVDTKLFTRIRMGHVTKYYTRGTKPPFHNMYRIVSISGTPDHITYAPKNKKG